MHTKLPMRDESEFTHKEPCPACGSRDNLARYSDGHGYCFGCEHYEPGDGEEVTRVTTEKDWTPCEGEARGLPKRRISQKTCEKFGYITGTYNGEPVQACAVRDRQGRLLGQKLRFKDKRFKCIGNVSNEVLTGMHLWSGGKKIVITEGEIDMLSYAEVTDSRYPVCSLPNGCQSAPKVLGNCREYLEKFDEIILLFDNDEPGQAAAKKAAKVLPPEKVRIATVPGHKDVNDALVAGDRKAIISCIFDASEYRPSEIVTIDDIFEKALERPAMGLSLPWPTATEKTLGVRRGEIHIVGAAPKIGKTEHQHQLIKHMTDTHGLRVGVMSLEEKPVKTAKKVAGKYVGMQFTKPPEVGGYTEDDVRRGLEKIRGKIEFYSSEGVRDYSEVLNTIRFWASTGIWFFIVDPLTALVAEHDSSTANDVLNEFMSKAASMCQELDLTIFMYSHVNPVRNGIPHDQGGEVLSSQFTGSRAMEKWAHYGWGIVRNRNEPDPIKRNTSEHVLLFDREFGEYCRYSCFYDVLTNDYREISAEEKHFGNEVEEEF